MPKAAPPTALQSVFALYNLLNTAIGTIHDYRHTGQRTAAQQEVTVKYLRGLPTKLKSALTRRPNTPTDLEILVNRAINIYNAYGAAQRTSDALQIAADWAKSYLQENMTPRRADPYLPPTPPSASR